MARHVADLLRRNIDRIIVVGLTLVMTGRWRPFLLAVEAEEGVYIVVSSGYVPLVLWRAAVVVAIGAGMYSMIRPRSRSTAVATALVVTLSAASLVEYVIASIRYGIFTANAALISFGFMCLVLGAGWAVARMGRE